MSPKKTPPSALPRPRSRAYIALGVLFAVIFATSYAGDMRAQVAGDSWFMRTLLPFARQTLSPDKFDEFLRRVNGDAPGTASSSSLSSAFQRASSPAASSSWSPSPLPPVTVSPKPVLVPGEKRCEFDAPSPLCTANTFPHFIPESCTNGISTGWVFTCDPVEQAASSASSEPYNPVCGNGFLDPGEQCDDGDLNTAEGSHCRPGCRLPFCGDRVVDPGEQCDDGNDVFTDGCAFCRSVFCGDGVCEKGLEDGTGAPGNCPSGQTCSFYNFYCGLDCGSMQ